MGVAPWAAWAAWFDILLAQGERGAACWGYFSWNRISEQSTLSRSLSSHAEAKTGGDISYAGEQSYITPRRWCLIWVWWMNLKCSSWNNFWREILLGLQPVAPTPLAPDLHHCGLSFLQDKTSFMALSFWLNFLQPFPWIPSFSQGSTTPEAPIFNPKHWATGILQTKTEHPSMATFPSWREVCIISL